MLFLLSERSAYRMTAYFHAFFNPFLCFSPLGLTNSAYRKQSLRVQEAASWLLKSSFLPSYSQPLAGQEVAVGNIKSGNPLEYRWLWALCKCGEKCRFGCSRRNNSNDASEEKYHVGADFVYPDTFIAIA